MSDRQPRAASARASLAWKVDKEALAKLRDSERTHKSSKNDARKAAVLAKIEAKKEAKLAAVAAATIGDLEPSNYTDMATIRRLKGKYSLDQLDWCARRLPAGMLMQGWEVLPEDAGGNFSSYNEGHFMYAFTGEVAGKGGNVPYFTGTTDAIAWWEAWLLARSAEAGGAPPPLPRYLKDSVVYAEGDEAEPCPVEALGLRLWRCAKSRTRTTGLQGVTCKTEGDGTIFIAKHDSTHLGTFATAVEAAYAFAAHLAVRGAVLGPGDDPNTLPVVSRDAPKPKRPPQPESLPNVAKRPKASPKRSKPAAAVTSHVLLSAGGPGAPYAAETDDVHAAVLRACGCTCGAPSAPGVFPPGIFPTGPSAPGISATGGPSAPNLPSALPPSYAEAESGGDGALAAACTVALAGAAGAETAEARPAVQGAALAGGAATTSSAPQCSADGLGLPPAGAPNGAGEWDVSHEGGVEDALFVTSMADSEDEEESPPGHGGSSGDGTGASSPAVP